MGIEVKTSGTVSDPAYLGNSPRIKTGCLIWSKFGANLPRSLHNDAPDGADLTAPAGTPTVGADYIRLSDRGHATPAYLQSAVVDPGVFTIFVVAKNVSTAAIIIGVSLTSSPLGEFGFNLFYNSGTNIRFQREANNSGTPVVVQENLTLDASSNWKLFRAVSDGTNIIVYNETDATNSGTTALGFPVSESARTIRIGAAYSTSTTGQNDLGFLGVYDTALSASDAALVVGDIRAIEAARGRTV